MEKLKNFVMSQFSRSCHCSSYISRYICLYLFVAWVNLKNIFDSDIFIENIAIFANTFFKYKILVIDYAGSLFECAVFCAHGLLKSTHGKY